MIRSMSAAVPILIGFMVNDKEKLFCSSNDLITVLRNESTHFCTIAGMIILRDTN